MANMNTKRTGIVTDKNTMLNHEGAVVHKLNALQELLNRVMGSYMGESGHYDKTNPENDFDRIKELISEIAPEDREYILKIAAIGREAGMISYPLAVLTAAFNTDDFKGENFKDENGRNKLASYTDKIVRRGRDITDVLSMQMTCYGFDVNGGKRTTPLPMQERKNLKRKLEEFDEYKIAKALGKAKMVSMSDAVKLLRPANKNDFFKQVIEGNVQFANGKKQVQSEMTKVNNKTSESTVKDLKESIAESSLLAIVKNLVGLQRKNAIDSEVADIIVEKLSSPDVVRGSKVMPYELYNAYEMFARKGGRDSIRISDALVKAIDMSVDNVDAIDGYSAIFVDLSGSMGNPVSEKSSTSCRDMASLLAAIAVKKSSARVFAFADIVKEVKVSSTSTVVDIMKTIRGTSVGGCTYLMKALQAVANDGDKFDNVIILSDSDAYSYNDKLGLVLGSSWGDRRGSCDELCSKLINKGIFKRFFINNLNARNFSVINTDDYRKNLVTGFTERYIDEINFSILLQRESADIRRLIDVLYNKYYGVRTNAGKGKKKR